nr:hypothetical protein [Acidobacteriota bacterium]
MKRAFKWSFASALTTLLLAAGLVLSSPATASIGGTCSLMDECGFCPYNFRWTTSTCTDGNGREHLIGICFDYTSPGGAEPCYRS